MHSSTVVITLGCLLSCTTTIYFFYIPDALRENDVNNLLGHWGSPNSDFDWCEYNYLLNKYIAEPWNTISGFIYIILGISLYLYYKQLRTSVIEIDKLLTLLIMLILIGIGTVLFHATLQYKMQLLDELPMYYFISYGFVLMYTRCDITSILYNTSIVFCSVLSCILLLFTNRDELFHQIARGIMVCTYSIYFIYIFYVGATVSKQCKNKIIEQLFDRCFGIWIFSIAFWFIDNVFCDVLQTQLPYLQYHATAWHLGSAIGIHYFVHVILCYVLTEKYSFQIDIAFLFNILPYIRIPLKKKTK